jgi:cytosine/adenosine deaminase-related metal-dependent hydrolase
MPATANARLPIRKRKLLLRARAVLPISRTPISNGAILIAGDRIAEVGRWRDLAQRERDETFDLGDAILLPGLINAHCHLDYTDMAGQFSPPKIFSDWLKLITTAKGHWNKSDYATSWMNGAQMLLRTGTTTVGDVEAMPELLPEVWSLGSLRVLSFLEMIGITGRRKPEEIVQEALDKIDSLDSGRCCAGLSPHAPYSTVPELLRLSADAARKRGMRICVHVAESSQEFEMFMHGRGEMHNWLRRSTREMSDCGLGSPVRHLARCGVLGENLLAIHANCLAKGDVALLAKHKVHVVHCPRSHQYFRHEGFALSQLSRAGINVCLGTDSLASVVKTRRETVELNIFEEMRALANRETSLPPKRILQMATVNGARALGMGGRIGEFAPGAFADAIAIPYSGELSGIHDAVMSHKGDVSSSMIDGEWVRGADVGQTVAAV